MKPIQRFTSRHRLLEEDQIEDLRLAASRLKGAVGEARRINAQQDLSRVHAGSHDEIFQGGRPVLVGVSPYKAAGRLYFGNPMPSPH